MASDIRKLSPKVKLVWEFPTILTIAIFWVVASLAYAVLPENSAFGLSHLAFPFALLLALLALVALPVHIWTSLIYRSFTFELTDKEMVIREGVITRKTTVIPYARIQDIRSERTVIERLLGLATLEIETAGSAKAASETLLPGIENKDKLIAELMERVEKAKGGSGVGEEAAVEGSMQKVLSEVLKELKTISSKLDNLGSPGASGARGEPLKGKRDIFEPLEHDEFRKYRKK